MIYVASSWRNKRHADVVTILRAAGHECYDFKNPTEENTGFHWTQVGMPSYELKDGYEVPSVPVPEYLKGIAHPIAEQGFKFDFDAMKACDTCVLVLPCGRSAHLELGWFCGEKRRTAILLEDEPMIPELMYKMVDHLAPNITNLVEWLGPNVPLPANFREGVYVAYANLGRPASAFEILGEMHRLWPREWRLCSVIDVADAMQEKYGKPGRD